MKKEGDTMTTFTSASALKKAIKRKATEAMNMINKEGLRNAEQNTHDFYSGTPLIYKRTGALGESPDTTGVFINGSLVSTEIFLDDTYSYDTGTWTAPQVIKAAETGYGNLVGSPGFWQRTVDDMPKIIADAFHSNGFE